MFLYIGAEGESHDFPVLSNATLELQGHTGVVMAADWLATTSQVITASWDRTANLYDSESGEVINTLTGEFLTLFNDFTTKIFQGMFLF